MKTAFRIRLLAAGCLAAALGLAGCGQGSRSEPAAVRSGGLDLRAAVEPAALRVGENRMWLELSDAEGRPVDGAEVEVEVRMAAMGAMPAMGGPASVTPMGDGTYRADFALEMGGTYQVAIEARAPTGAIGMAEGSLTVGTPGLRLGAGGEAPASAEGAPEFSVDLARLQRIGVRTAAAETATVEHVVRTVGRVAWDETALVDVTARVRGFVAELVADAVGVPVEQGQVLLRFYSPDLYTAQQEYLLALRSQRAARETSAPDRSDYLVRAARTRLRLWDVGPADLDRIAEQGAPLENVPLRAPASGFVIEKDVVAGGAVEPGQRLYRIAPLDRVWLEAEVYESELSMVSVGQAAEVTLAYLPGRIYTGEVSYVYPYLAGATRTARVRIVLQNPEGALRPDMYANVELRSARGERLVVPESAILHAGDRDFVFKDLGEGRFRPVRVQVGMRDGERIEILSGLAPGERIVTSGTFLIASESRLRAALDQW